MAPTSIRIVVNGESRNIDLGLTVAGLLRAMQVRSEGVAVERNRQVVRRIRHEDEVLADGDIIEIVQFVGGGCV